MKEGESIAEERTRKQHAEKAKPEKKELVYESYDLRIIQQERRTGFEPTKDFPIVANTVIAGRYRIEELLGQAAFSRAVMCKDLHTKEHVRRTVMRLGVIGVNGCCCVSGCQRV